MTGVLIIKKQQLAACLNEQNEWSVTGQIVRTCPLHPYVSVVIINYTHPNVIFIYLNDVMIVDSSSSSLKLKYCSFLVKKINQ